MTQLSRIVRFAMVGTICFIVQWCTMLALQNVIHTLQACIVAFIVSAQLNFVLSSVVTWRDQKNTQRQALKWVKFNTSVLLATGINAGALWVFVECGFWLWSALILANSISMVFTFIVNSHVVYGKANGAQTAKFGVFYASLQRG